MQKLGEAFATLFRRAATRSPAVTVSARCLLCLLLGLGLFGGGFYWGFRQGATEERLKVSAFDERSGSPLAGTEAPDAPANPRQGAANIAPESGAHTAADKGLHASPRTKPFPSGGETAQAPPAEGAQPGGLPLFPDSGHGEETHRAEIPLYPFARASDAFSLHKLGSGYGPTLLVVGGIQGDEPGGFSAAALLASHYRILSGSVWVVPDLNYPSILRRHRGIFGDMNRKFAAIDPTDPEFTTVSRIKDVLLSERVSLILNLHDGSGFYRPTWEDGLRNPKRWGQAVIIDQEEVEAPPFMLFETAGHVESEVNRALLDPAHRYHIYNTFTAHGNEEMAKTLSWFAVSNGKPAFGIEASKEFTTEYRAYYHLHVVEAFMRRLGIDFERDFTLTPAGVTAALNGGLRLSAFDGRLVLELDDVRPTLNHVPFKKGAEPDERASKPLMALVADSRQADWRVAYGNRTLTRLIPEYRDFDESLTHVDMIIDGEARRLPLGSVVRVEDSFTVRGREGYRVNAIGAQKEVDGNEADVPLLKSDFMPRFSVDKKGTLFRVEVYKDQAFAGMLLVRFGPPPANALPAPGEKPLTAREGRESDFGM